MAKNEWMNEWMNGEKTTKNVYAYFRFRENFPEICQIFVQTLRKNQHLLILRLFFLYLFRPFLLLILSKIIRKRIFVKIRKFSFQTCPTWTCLNKWANVHEWRISLPHPNICICKSSRMKRCIVSICTLTQKLCLIKVCLERFLIDYCRCLIFFLHCITIKTTSYVRSIKLAFTVLCAERCYTFKKNFLCILKYTKQS